MKLWHFILLNALAALLIAGCAARPARTWQADETWTHLGHP
jgi:hypothetical protein